MDRTAQVEDFLHCTRARNRREIIVGAILMVIFALLAFTASIGSVDFYGNLLLVLGLAVVIGVIWFTARPRGDLQRPGAGNVEHWSAEMQRQAKLLRRTPLWYVGPLIPGFVLLFWPSNPALNPLLAWLPLLILAVAFAAVIWLNRRAAADLTRQARAIRSQENT